MTRPVAGSASAHARETRTVLTIAGSDPIGGAGVQGDLKTFAAHGVYGMAVLTALTVQNTRGVTRVEPMAPDLVGDQIAAVLSDIEPQAIKIGMLATGAIVRVVAHVLAGHCRDRAASGPPAIVVDPVMAATAGGALLDADGVVAVRDTLLPLATVVTPNTIEAERLTGVRVSSAAEAHQAAERLVSLGAAAAIVTGGHLDGPPIDVLFDGVRAIALGGPRIDPTDTHGTGCAFSSALAARLALGDSLEEAARRAKTYVADAIRRAPRLGHGRGPLGHA
jgi:hydroxymethylpyrimidine kinase/phosphomethylpyrimidine kinase